MSKTNLALADAITRQTDHSVRATLYGQDAGLSPCRMFHLSQNSQGECLQHRQLWIHGGDSPDTVWRIQKNAASVSEIDASALTMERTAQQNHGSHLQNRVSDAELLLNELE